MSILIEYYGVGVRAALSLLAYLLLMLRFVYLWCFFDFSCCCNFLSLSPPWYLHYPMNFLFQLFELGNADARGELIQGDFFNWPSPENVSRLAPPKFAWTGPPPNFSKCWNHIHFARHLDIFWSWGGPVWDSNDFLKSVTYRPTLSKFRGGPVKKITL